jgi:hypothetical protein
MEDRVNPIRVTDEDTKETYTLDFNRESVVFMAQRNFTMDDLSDTIAVKGEELWYYAFRANHKKMSRNQTDKLYEKMGGLAPKLIKRLIELYYQALNSNKIVQDDDELEANPHVTVEL